MLSNTHEDDEAAHHAAVEQVRRSTSDDDDDNNAGALAQDTEAMDNDDITVAGPDHAASVAVEVDETDDGHASPAPPSRPTRARTSGPYAIAIAQELADAAVAGDSAVSDDHDVGSAGRSARAAAALSTAPASLGAPFYPTVATHVRLSLFTTQGPTDTWAAFVVALLFLVIFVWGTVTLATFSPDQYAYWEADRIHQYGSLVVSINLLTSLLVMVLLLGGVLYFPAYVLMGLAGLGTLMLFVATIVALLTVDFVAALLMLFLVFIQFFYAFLNRHTLMRCTEAVRTVGLVWRTYPAMVVATVCVSLLAHAFVLLFSGVLLPYIILLVSNQASFLELFVVWLFLMILVWFASIFPCVVSVIVGGVTATWYALEGDPAGNRIRSNPDSAAPPSTLYTNLNPTFWMTVRAFWTNAGTVCLVAALSVQASCWHWLAEGMSEVACFARCTCCQDCMRSALVMTEMAYRSFNWYSLMRVSINGDKFIDAGRQASEVVAKCRDLTYFRHRLHVLTPLMVLYAMSTAVMMMLIFGSISWSLGCYSLISVGVTVHTFATIVHQTWRALLYCDGLDRQPMSVAAPALQLEMDSVREEGERHFTEQAAAQEQPVVE